jgi:hypothetical protein
MPRKIPKKINYMDMKIPFDLLPIPKARKEQAKLIERFDLEFGEDYMLDFMIDPSEDYKVFEPGCPPMFDNELDLKVERIKRRKYFKTAWKKAIESNDADWINRHQELRVSPDLPCSDDGWNVSVINKRGGV